MIMQFCIENHSVSDCIQKTCSRSSQSKCQHGGGGVNKVLPLAEMLKATKHVGVGTSSFLHQPKNW